ncbi:MAG: hypothetical protein AOA65_0405 [Candidatus Bathyarchaeota archaeon BA1]|nr:MAG: hypothetical protein AOA65_0405 [Candidatus Bathyarchaeota archaeon BA1]
MQDSEHPKSVEGQLFYTGLGQYLSLLISHVEAHPNFKKVTEGLDLSPHY